MPSFDSRSRSYAPPFRGQPVDLPIEIEADQPDKVQVHIELGVPIFFSPRTRQFTAKLRPHPGQGSSSDLRSNDFDNVVQRIRARALVVPVAAYQLDYHRQDADDDTLVRVIPCTVIEHHPRRLEPYVVLIEDGTRRSYTTDVAYLPRPEHIERLREITRAIRDEGRRHRTENERLLELQRRAVAAIPQLGADQIHYVQEGGAQVAVAPEMLGAIVYDVIEDDTDQESTGS